MAKPLDPLAEFVCDQLRDWAPVTARRLFGGWGVYNGPVMFGLIARDTIYFRVDDENRADYIAAATKPFLHTARRRSAGGNEIATGPKPFTYEMPNGKIIEMAYYEVPPEILDDTELLSQWAVKAQSAALRAKSGKAKAKASSAQPKKKKNPPKKSGRK